MKVKAAGSYLYDFTILNGDALHICLQIYVVSQLSVLIAIKCLTNAFATNQYRNKVTEC